MPGRKTDPELQRVLESAARLQQVVPDAVLVGGTAAALHAGHRLSLDHDHVLGDLRERFDLVLEAVESCDGWVTNRVVPGKLILGTLGEIEAGVRQMLRRKPLETEAVELPNGETVVVPTMDETLRIKAWLIVRRNQTRDFLDVAALVDSAGLHRAVKVLGEIDHYYADQHQSPDGVASQLVRQLGSPKPADASVTRELSHYKALAARWHDWNATVRICREVARKMVESG